MDFNITNIDFYDFEALEKLQNERAQVQLALILLAEKGDLQAKRDLKKHEQQNKFLKIECQRTGYPWF